MNGFLNLLQLRTIEQEAANLGIKLKDDEVAFRCNLITEKDGLMDDYSAGHIPSDEAKELIEYLVRNLAKKTVF